MPAPRWLARFNLQVTNRILGPLAKHVPGMGIIIHAGRKTHRQYRTPVMIFRRSPRFIIALTYGRESEWVKNVLAEGGCELETQGKTIHVSHPRIFHDPQRRTMPALVALFLRILNVSDFLEVTTESGM